MDDLNIGDYVMMILFFIGFVLLFLWEVDSAGRALEKEVKKQHAKDRQSFVASRGRSKTEAKNSR